MLVNAKITLAGSCERNWSTFELIHSKKCSTNWLVLQ